mgnify:CR=1 FL=1
MRKLLALPIVLNNQMDSSEPERSMIIRFDGTVLIISN